jgi:hypothetical protein
MPIYFSFISHQLSPKRCSKSLRTCFPVAVRYTIGPSRFPQITAAAAHDLNEELTVILTSVTESLRALAPDHAARPFLLDLRSAAQRCAWKASGLLNASAREGAGPSAATFEALIGNTGIR